MPATLEIPAGRSAAPRPSVLLSATLPLPKVGEQVQFAVNQQKSEGTVGFAGETEFAPGQWVGVILETPDGKNDGIVKDKRYFTCKPQHGLFIRPQNILKTKSGKGEQNPKPNLARRASRTDATSAGDSSPPTSPPSEPSPTGTSSPSSAPKAARRKSIAVSAEDAQEAAARPRGYEDLASGRIAELEAKLAQKNAELANTKAQFVATSQKCGAAESELKELRKNFVSLEGGAEEAAERAEKLIEQLKTAEAESAASSAASAERIGMLEQQLQKAEVPANALSSAEGNAARLAESLRKTESDSAASSAEAAKRIAALELELQKTRESAPSMDDAARLTAKLTEAEAESAAAAEAAADRISALELELGAAKEESLEASKAAVIRAEDLFAKLRQAEVQLEQKNKQSAEPNAEVERLRCELNAQQTLHQSREEEVIRLEDVLQKERMLSSKLKKDWETAQQLSETHRTEMMRQSMAHLDQAKEFEVMVANACGRERELLKEVQQLRDDLAQEKLNLARHLTEQKKNAPTVVDIFLSNLCCHRSETIRNTPSNVQIQRASSEDPAG